MDSAAKSQRRQDIPPAELGLANEFSLSLLISRYVYYAAPFVSFSVYCIELREAIHVGGIDVTSKEIGEG